ncbi:MAG: response regulator [Candidatus Kapabacteria bacterium]|nr:response regulator [Candidatus Kapabacteria bacterium]
METSLNERRILIVDDTKENIDVLGGLLSNYKRSVALNGMKALQIAKENKPDLILLDIMMPEMDGFEVCERLKADPDTRDIPVIFITAKNEVADEVRGLELGAVDFISKPISPPIVVSRVKNHLELKISRENLELKNIELIKTFEELKNTQNQLIHSEKMSALGQLVAGIAHEINTPLGAINSSNKAISKEMLAILPELSKFGKILTEDIEAMFKMLMERAFGKHLSITSREERQFRRDITSLLEQNGVSNSDSKAELLVELGVYENVEPFFPLMKKESSMEVLKAAQNLTSIKSSNDIITIAVEKVAKIVFSLKNFTRFDAEGKKVDSDIQESIDTTLTIYNSQIKQGVEIIKEFNINRQIQFIPDQINQVWTNLIHNSLHAMEGKGTISIKTNLEDKNAVISFTDTGKGMTNEVKAKIFDAFFTTKPQGEGTGLGLDIVKKIIKNHDGRIEVESEVGVGTTFTVYLPLVD